MPPVDAPTRPLRTGSDAQGKRSDCGAAASPSIASKVFPTSLGLAGRVVFPPRHIAVVKALACELPAQRGEPLSRYSLNDLARVAGKEEPFRSSTGPPSKSSVRRWLDQDALRPWRHQSWIHSRDPEFLSKAGRVLDLYEGKWQGKPLKPTDTVVCADVKTSIQARKRCHPTTPPESGQVMRVEHEYERCGALNYIASFFPQTGHASGRCAPHKTREDFQGLVHQVMALPGPRKATRVFWVVDNGSEHRPTTFPEWLKNAYPSAVPVFLPTHASWLNQIEIYFGIVETKVLRPNDVASLPLLAERILKFEERYSKKPEPFDWDFTKDDLKELLDELG